MMLRPGRAILVVVLVALASAGAGYLAGSTFSGHAEGSSSTGSSTFSVLAAGTLGVVFPQLARTLANESPGISSPSAAQLYEGSLAVANALAQGTASADVAAVADFRLIPHLLEPGAAAYEVVFASTAEVLVYDSNLTVFHGVNSSNWGQKLVTATTGAGALPFAVWNASIDPNGYNEIFSLALQGALSSGNASSLYQTFYSGALGSFAVPNPTTTRVEPESQAKTYVTNGVVCAAITYRSYAVENHLAYVSFDPVVGLEATTPSALGQYANLSTTILTASGGLSVVHAAPILFSATVPRTAPNAALGADFLHLLLSPQGAAVLGAGGGFDPIFPGWSDQPTAVPADLAPDVVPLPAWAAADLT